MTSNREWARYGRYQAMQRELVPWDFLVWLTEGLCDFCGTSVDQSSNWVLLDDGAWIEDRLLWSETRIAHQMCADFERHLRKKAALNSGDAEPAGLEDLDV